MPDAMCLWKLDANAYTKDDDDDGGGGDNIVDDGIKFWRPRAKYSETHIRLSPGALSIGCFRYLWLSLTPASSRVAIFLFYFATATTSDVIKFKVLPVSYLISQREACIVFDFFSLLSLFFIFEVRHFRWIRLFFSASLGRYQRKGTELLQDKCVEKFLFFYYRWNDDSTFQ